MAIYDINGNIISSGGEIEIKDYFESEMEDTVSKVRALQTEPNLTFFYITDIHAYLVSGKEELYKTSVNNMRYLLTEVPCDGVVNLGDSIDGYSTAAIAKNYGNMITKEFRKIGVPYYYAIGNHDDNRYHSDSTSERLAASDRYQILVSASKRVVPDQYGLNFYVDYPEFKIRMIFLNGVSNYGYSFSANTCTWFSNVALDTPEGYGILVNTHISPFSAWNYSQTNPTNGATIKSAMDSYAITKDVIGLICGHNHVDAVFSAPYPGATLGCNKFTSTNGDPSNWPEGAVIAQRETGTYTEDLWTVVVVRPNSGKINLVRFGAGSDYEITYKS